MILAATVFFAPPVMAQTITPTSATLVREVTLSPGNWLWNHYARMSPEYRRAHPYKQFLETEACYLTDRKCTEADWKRVPKTQVVYIPAEPVFVRVPPGASIPGIILEESTGGIDHHGLVIDNDATDAEGTARLYGELKNLEAINKDLSSKYAMEGAFWRKAVAFLIFSVIAFGLLAMFLWTRLLPHRQKLQKTKPVLDVPPTELAMPVPPTPPLMRGTDTSS